MGRPGERKANGDLITHWGKPSQVSGAGWQAGQVSTETGLLKPLLSPWPNLPSPYSRWLLLEASFCQVVGKSKYQDRA